MGARKLAAQAQCQRVRQAASRTATRRTQVVLLGLGKLLVIHTEKGRSACQKLRSADKQKGARQLAA